MNQVRLTRPLYIIVLLLPFAAGIISGILFQKYYGVGSLLTAAGIRNYFSSSMPKSRLTSTPVGVPDEFQGRMSLFVLAGQSNMSGRGDLPSNQSIHPRVFMFGNNYRWSIAVEPIDNPEGQVDEISKDSAEEEAGFSPGLAFATSLLKQDPSIVIGLVPCARGDTSIEEWQSHLSDNTLYGSCLKRIRAASVMGEVAGLLFFQGEADAKDPRDHDGPLSTFEYADKFLKFVNDIRRDLSLPNLPVVFAQIGTNTAPDYFFNWEIIKEQQAAVRLPCSAMITTDDLPLRDAVHFTTDSYQKIGERFAEMFSSLIRAQDCQ